MSNIDTATLTAQSSDAAKVYVDKHCPHSDVHEKTQRASDFAKGFYAGVRFLEYYADELALLGRLSETDV